MPLETIEHRRLYRQVADQLRTLIDDGEFAPGARLPAERELAEKLGISRPTVREALIALEVEGKIRIRVGSGIYVAEAPQTVPPVQAVQAEAPFEVLHARELVESAIAADAALRATPEDLADLERILSGMGRSDHPSIHTIQLDRAFHVAIASILGNSLLARVVGELFDQRINPYYSQLARHFESNQTWALALAEHRRIFERIAAGDPDGAREAMRAHLQASQGRFSQSFGETAQPRAASNRAKPTGDGADGARPPQSKPTEER